MKKKKALTNKAGQVRELTRNDIRKMKPAVEILPAEVFKIFCLASLPTQGEDAQRADGGIE